MVTVALLVGRAGPWWWLFVIFDNAPKRTMTVPFRSHELDVDFRSDDGANKEFRRLFYKLGVAYENQGIQGVLDGCDEEESSLTATINILSCGAIEDVVQQTPKASLERRQLNHYRGKLTGVLNGIMGWCCLRRCQTGSETYGRLCKCLFETYSNLKCWKPDIVTLALAFTGVVDTFPDLASRIMCHAKQVHNYHNDIQEPLTVSYRHEENLFPTHTIDVLHDDSDLLVLNKPSGMSLSDIGSILLQQRMPLSDVNPDGSRGIVHRLDTGTSGCLVIAKSNAMHLKLVSQFFLRHVRKSYIALVFNPDDGVELPCSGNIDLPISGRPARSHYSIHPVEGKASVLAGRDRTTRMRIETQQGRKHQVRIHCSKGLRRPVLLDSLYGGERVMYWVDSTVMKQARANKQFCLHADQLSLPAMGVHVSAQTPFWWDQIVEDINKSLLI
jgi:23S rRNA-/tRNA-specific pseudouridylate synthase